MKFTNEYWEGDYDPYLPDIEYEDILVEAGCEGSSPSADTTLIAAMTQKAVSL